MKIYQIHNNYKYLGGEEAVVEEEAKLLISNNHEVIRLIKDNAKELKLLKDKIFALKNISYSKKNLEILDKEIIKYGIPDIVHVHNIFPLWTYSVFDFFNKKKIPIIMTLHNYRLIWEKLGFFQNNREKYGYFQDSNFKSFLVSKLINKRKDLLEKVTRFITLTEFAKKEFSSNGFPENKLVIKPNFLNSKRNNRNPVIKKKSAIYASRISKEKGILTLIKAFQNLDLNIDILGDGPLLTKIKKNNKNHNIKFHGSISRDETSKFINGAKFIVVPSECYEGFPMTILEAFREGTLVLASNIGSIKSIIKNKYNGILFEFGNKLDLINKVKWILNNPKECDQIIKNAINDFDNKYSSQVNYKKLIKIYEEAIKENKNKYS